MTTYKAAALSLMKLLPVWPLLGGIACYGQNGEPVTAFIPFNTYPVAGAAVINNSIQRIDSIALAAGSESHFCKIYSQTMNTVALQLQEIDSGSREFIQKFEIGFADYFLTAWARDRSHTLPLQSGWKCFFSNRNAKPWQIVLLGVNAHTNIDIWRTLVYNFSEAQVMQYHKQMLAMQASVNKVHDQFFRTLLAESRYLRFINTVTMGFARKFGEKIIYKWRKRNVKLALLYYSNEKRFTRKLEQVNRKKIKNDERILRYRS